MAITLTLGQGQADSFKQVIKEQSGIEKQKTKLDLCKLLLNNGKTKEAIIYYHSFKKDLDLLTPKQTALMYLNMGVCHQYERRSDSTVYYLNLHDELIKTTDDTSSLANSYLTHGAASYDLSDPEGALKYTLKSQKIYLAQNDTKSVAMTTINLSVLYADIGKINKRLEMLKESQRILIKTGEYNYQRIFYTNLGSAFNSVGLFDSSIYYFGLALQLAEEQNDSLNIASYLGNISQVLTNTLDLKRAFLPARRALKLNLGIKNGYGQAYSYFSLGRIHSSLNQVDSSLYYNKISLQKCLKNKVNLLEGVLYNIGSNYLDLELPDSAKKYFEECLVQRQKLQIISEFSSVYSCLAHVAALQKDKTMTKKWEDSTMAYFDKTQDLTTKGIVYKNLSKVREALGDYKTALTYISTYYAYEDSVLEEEKIVNTKALSYLYETGKKAILIDQLKAADNVKELKLEKGKNQIITLVVALSLLGLIALLLVKMYMSKRNHNTSLAKANEEITKKSQQLAILNKEIYHRAKNNLQTISSLLGLQRYEIKDDNTRKLIIENRNRVNAMAIINKRLFSNDQLGNINFKEFLTEITNELQYSYSIDESTISIEFQSADINLDADEAVPVSLIINELIANSIKYGLTNPNEPKIRITTSLSDFTFHFKIQDNGQGFIEDFKKEKSESFGWEMIDMLTSQLQGKLETYNDGGAVVKFQFPTKNQIKTIA